MACRSDASERARPPYLSAGKGIDPRDQTWELARPSYRVYFHDSHGVQDEYEVRGADFSDVLAWAEAQRGARTFVLYVCVPGDGLGLVRLHGGDPNAR